MELPIPPYQISKLKTNISYGQIQSFSFEELSDWTDDLREELLSMWVDENQPPVIGVSKDLIIDRFKKLKDYDVNSFFIEDELYEDYLGFIKNFSKLASGVNQFFPALLKTRVMRGSETPLSIYDFLSNEKLFLHFKHEIVQKTRFDKMYLFTDYLKYDGDDIEDFIERWVSGLDTNTDFYLEPSNTTHKRENNGKVVLDMEMIKSLQKREIFNSDILRNKDGYDIKNEMEEYYIRYYDKRTTIFTHLFQILRLGLNQVAVNFPPLTARYLYEKYLPSEKSEVFKVYDNCAGWGGRLLGSLCSNLPIHYIGTDTNLNNKGCYERLGEFYNEHTDGKNTFEIHYVGAETIHKDENFKEHFGDVDMVFTSPPYFNREIYSDDEEQSCNKYKIYDDWRDYFLKPLIQNSYDILKNERYCLININDIRRGEKDFIPLEQDTIQLAYDIGFEYIGKIGMCMSRMIGQNPTTQKNFYLEMKTQTTYKVEPIFVFHKPLDWPWNK